jgi:hypothetical protein
MPDRPETVRLHLTRHRQVQWMVFPIAAIAVITAAVYLATRLFGDPELEAAGVDTTTDWSAPLLGIGLIVLAALAIFIISSVWLWLNERRHARRTIAAAMVCWPQFRDRDEWIRQIDQDDRAGTSRLSDALIPSLIVTVIAGGLGLWGALAGVPSAAFALGGFWLVVMWLIWGTGKRLSWCNRFIF